MNHSVNNWHVGYLICDTKEVLIHRLITTSLSGGTLSNPFLSGRQAQSICWTLDGLQFLCRYPEMGTAGKHGKHRGEPYRPEVGLQDIQIWAETEVRSALERWRRTECEDWLFRDSDLHPEETAVVVETHKEIMNKMVGKSINSRSPSY